VTFAEVRRHLGIETQRQRSKLAIARTTPALLGLFSLLTLWAEGGLDGDIAEAPTDLGQWPPTACCKSVGSDITAEAKPSLGVLGGDCG